MFEHRPNRIKARGLIVAVCMALLASCGGGSSGSSSGPAVAPVGGAPGISAPTTPANLTGTGGDSVVTLTWTASSGATSYNVKRATLSGGPYTQLATATSPSYADSTVSNGTTYYYVVSASSSGGESALSAQAAVAPASSSPGTGSSPPSQPSPVTPPPSNPPAGVRLQLYVRTGFERCHHAAEPGQRHHSGAGGGECEGLPGSGAAHCSCRQRGMELNRSPAERNSVPACASIRPARDSSPTMSPNSRTTSS